jgi:hypothetical protein
MLHWKLVRQRALAKTEPPHRRWQRGEDFEEANPRSGAGPICANIHRVSASFLLPRPALAIRAFTHVCDGLWEGRGRGADFPQAQTCGEAPSPGAQEHADLSPHAGRGEGARQTAHAGASPAMRRMNTLLRRTNSLFGRKNFRVFGGAGNRLQAIESACRLAAKIAQRGWNRAKFPKIPCYFPCYQGIQ